ncbi:MAG: alpha/beta fold hydrolase [candidate division NC10 bacterium]|nr:alpha/beta fold hydrolase [candidate division NC10 bacterium]
MAEVGVNSEIERKLLEEMERNLKRLANTAALVARPDDPPVGLTPRRLIYRRNKTRLYHYPAQGGSPHPIPILFVPNLGISRPYIFDLSPGSSFIEYMVKSGYHFYLLDWGVFGEEDNRLRVDDCVLDTLPRVIRRVLRHAGAPGLSLLGYCMGAPLGACTLALHPDVPVRAFVNMAGPFDFAKAGLFACWLDKGVFDVDRLVDTYGTMPAEMVRLGFKLLKPTMDFSTLTNLWWNAWNDQYVAGFKALNKWANDYVPLPGEFFRQWVKDFYQDNKLLRGELVLGGRRVDLANIRCPVLVVGAREDNICPPACARALLDAVSSQDKEYVELPGGHISLVAGRQAANNLWPRVSHWLAQRSRG